MSDIVLRALTRAAVRGPHALLVLIAVCAFAAVSRDAYRDAYKSWRQADPTLERDVATSGPAIAADIDRVANQAAKYGAARSSFLAQSAAEQERGLAFLSQEHPALSPFDPVPAQVITAETAAVRHSLDTYGNDPDRGIQQVRGLLERENLALAAVDAVLGDSQKKAELARSASVSEQQARIKALGLMRDAAAASNQQIAGTNQEATAWADYYRLLSDAARDAAPPPVTTPSLPAPEPKPSSAALPPLPTARYTGAWVFPSINGLFHGPQPEFVDLVVHEENGQASGTLFARFKVLDRDPVIRFDFSGEFQKTRNQVFNLETSDGAKGTIELIPGPAFNLLEVNFKTEPKPGKIIQANAVLVKK